MDQFDRAQELDARFREQALLQHTGTRGTAVSRLICTDCEEPIPAARREAVPGCHRCILCEEEFERR
jgi:phage/conjugal plasmid C-4 type zinc finger TraR family protein